MPLSRAMPRIWVGAVALAVFLCAAATAWSQSSTARMPREISNGAREMVVQRVEPEISQAEIFAAVQAQLDRETMCFPWPSVWLDPAERRRVFIVRFDLMERDWGGEVTARTRARLAEFVDMGVLVAREQSDIGPGVIEYRLTRLGDDRLVGSPASGRMSFCMPSERRVVEILETQFGNYPCGTLQVRFRHIADAWPSWARSQSIQTRVNDTWGAIGSPGDGAVSMSRQWFAGDPTDGRENGQMRSVCYDTEAREVRGEDMELYPALPAQ
ncbi:hypothetical protein [Vitreimonas flagellata]|uniref:hypothetical protein n=1 Tax=Vitreimonas flagellata TaxID=2560861 RepID=UPI00142FA388|nr:hypothetical protein [Vitreimonas flagellata]